jgi:hypothetical protein
MLVMRTQAEQLQSLYAGAISSHEDLQTNIRISTARAITLASRYKPDLNKKFGQQVDEIITPIDGHATRSNAY